MLGFDHALGWVFNPGWVTCEAKPKWKPIYGYADPIGCFIRSLHQILLWPLNTPTAWIALWCRPRHESFGLTQPCSNPIHIYLVRVDEATPTTGISICKIQIYVQVLKKKTHPSPPNKKQLKKNMYFSKKTLSNFNNQCILKP